MGDSKLQALDQTRNSHWTTKTKRISPSSSRARSLKERTTGRRPLPRQSKEHVEPTTREVNPPVTSGISYDRVIRTDTRTGPTMRSRTHEQQQQQHRNSCQSFFLRVKNKILLNRKSVSSLQCFFFSFSSTRPISFFFFVEALV